MSRSITGELRQRCLFLEQQVVPQESAEHVHTAGTEEPLCGWQDAAEQIARVRQCWQPGTSIVITTQLFQASKLFKRDKSVTWRLQGFLTKRSKRTFLHLAKQNWSERFPFVAQLINASLYKMTNCLLEQKDKDYHLTRKLFCEAELGVVWNVIPSLIFLYLGQNYRQYETMAASDPITSLNQSLWLSLRWIN